MTVKTIKFTDLPPYYAGNKADICIIDDVYSEPPKTQLPAGSIIVAETTNTMFPDLLGGMTIEEIEAYISVYTGEIIEFNPNMIHAMDAVAIDLMTNTGHERKDNPVPEWWNQKQEFTADYFKRAKAVRKRQLNKANRKRARHG